jgi:hypothetical protein
MIDQEKWIYPIGKYVEVPFSEPELQRRLLDIQFMPKALELVVQDMDDFQLNTSYRPGGWTCKQVIHHLADSHMNAYIRCKLALTEDLPIIKPYDQDVWVTTADVFHVAPNVSITLLHALHLRWHAFFSSLETGDWERKVEHPEYKRTMTIWYLLGLYAWHGKHHTEQIRSLKDRT